MTTDQVVETSVTNNSLSKGYPRPEDHDKPITDTPGFKPFTIVSSLSAVIFISFLDVNECEENNGGCEQQCVNKEGSHNCSCEGGFKLEKDGFKCTGDSIKRVNFREPNGTISNKGIPVCELDLP